MGLYFINISWGFNITGENMKIDIIEKNIGYKFKDKELLIQALAHSSYANDRKLGRTGSNERLEFLGDAVLELVSSDFIYKTFTEMPEGDMTKLRASLVCEPALAYSAREISLDKGILLSRGEECSGGRSRDSIVGDALEAVIGAIYLDGGIENAKKFVLDYVLNDIQKKQLFFDSKTKLQEVVQSRHDYNVEYKVLMCTGPDHDQDFECAVLFGEKILGVGYGKSKKKAEQNAALEALLKLKEGKICI